MKFLKNLLKFLTSRFMIISLLIIIQFALFLVTLYYFESYSIYFHYFTIALSYFLVIHILNKAEDTSYKLPWLIVVLMFPLAGSVAYLIFGSIVLPKKLVRKIQSENDKLSALVYSNKESYDKLKIDNSFVYGQATFISKSSKNSLSCNSKIEYYKCGEELFEKIKEELRKAKKYIFIEYFIISEGKMWSEIYEILKDKAKLGLDIRVMFDDVGSIKTMRNAFVRELEKVGIKCNRFNPFRPIASVVHNNRNHRKQIIIDGVVGISGGINIADEYINEINRFGYWKDNGFIIRGESVSNMLAMFLRSWNLYYKNKDKEYECLFPNKYPVYEEAGYSLMFGDAPRPIDNVHIGENAYLNIINQAKETLYITSPYLVVNNYMINALINASLRGVDVRIILPHIPDKKTIFMLSRSNYFELVKNNVKVYEFTPGFIHSKMVLCDNEIAILGTINFDYRSFIHHFECACFMYKVDCVKEMYEDFNNTISSSEEITIDKIKKPGLIKRTFLAILKFFAPLL